MGLKGWSPKGGGGGGGGGGGAAVDFPTRILEFTAVSDDLSSLLSTTNTTTSPATHNLTIPPGPARSLNITLTSHAGYVGPWTLTGAGPDGVERIVPLAIPSNGGTTIATAETFNPGTVVLSRPAQGGTSGQYTVGLGSRVGLAEKAFEVDDTTHLGLIVDAYPQDQFAGFAGSYRLVGPSSEGVNGAFEADSATVLAFLDGQKLAIAYVGDAR